MNRSDEDFSHCDLRGADLSNSTFYRANFVDADLWNCDFRDSDLTGARNLSQAQLAATDLTNAKLPEALATFESLDAVKDLSAKSSNIFTTLLISIVFTVMTSATIQDFRLLTNTGYIKLPVINIDAPVLWFYFVTPLTLCALFVYFHISLQRLWEAMATLPAIFPNGRRLDEKTPGWLMNDIPRQHIPRLRATAPSASRLQWLLCIVLGYWILPLAILFLWTQCLRFENWFLTNTYILLFAVTVATAAGFSRLMDRTLAGKASKPLRFEQSFMRLVGKARGLVAGATAGACLAALSYFGIEWDGMASSPVVDALHFFGIQTEANVDNQDMSTRPPTWTGMSNNVKSEIGLTRGARFANVPLRRLNAHNAFFVKSVFISVDLARSNFYNSDLRSAILDQVTGSHVRFLKCDFSDPIDMRLYTPADTDVEGYHAVTMTGCTLQSLEARASQMCAIRASLCDFRDADFTEGHLPGGVFTGIIFVGAKFDYADLRYSTFRGISAGKSQQEQTTFNVADCSHAKFLGISDFTGASFKGATLDDAVFEGVDLSGADFARASMVRADLSQALGLTEEQLKKAKTLHAAKVPGDLRSALAQLVDP